jgi:hypothetical protein
MIILIFESIAIDEININNLIYNLFFKISIFIK